jgi:superfamily II DNA/RNA helicase
MDSFFSLGLNEAICGALAGLGCAAPTPVQAKAIPAFLSGRDILMESETGTGKTFAYLAPALQLCQGDQRKGPPLVLVAAPTQELAVQIGKEAGRLSLAAGMELRSVVLLGGSPLSRQAGLLHGNPSLVVGTLGRLADLVTIGSLRLSGLKLLVLDEADRLLAPETEDATLSLLGKAPRGCARALVSATLPKRSRDKAAPFLRDPEIVAVAADRAVLAGDIEHWCFYCDGRKRLDFLRRLEASLKPERCLVFTSQAARVEAVTERLEAMGLPVAGIHARLEKEERRVALERFMEGKLRYLVTSDLGARGLDIAGLTHVLSLDFPEEPTVYIHRAGRTGRAGNKGLSIVLADAVELARASKLAVREGFVFRCKILEGGKVLEPTPEEFFERAERAEAQKGAHRAARDAAREGGAREQGRRPEGPMPRSHNAPSHNAHSHILSSDNARSHNLRSHDARRGPRPSGGGEAPGGRRERD